MTGVRWAACVILLGALVGCGDDQAPSSSPEPHLGAPRMVPSHTPHEAMDDLEQPVAEMLAPRLEDDGLRLDYVECPPWSGAVPAVLRCRGYVDGVVGEVVVRLSHRAGGRVDFDARLGGGVIAMTRLVDRLQRKGYDGVDCGAASAYPARVGLRIMCRVRHGGEADHVVATVVDRNGAVRIEDY
jgi:hypothetical protein